MPSIPEVEALRKLLTADTNTLIPNVPQIEEAAQKAVKAMSGGGFDAETFLIVLNAQAFREEKDPFVNTAGLGGSDPGSFLENALKGDVSLVLIAALAGRPIGYPLLGIRWAIQKYDQAARLSFADLLSMVHGFGQVKTTDMVTGIAMDISEPSTVKILNELVTAMIPPVAMGAESFTPNPIVWAEGHKIIPIPVPTPAGGGGGGGGGGGTPKVQEQSDGSDESDETGIFIVLLLLICVAAFALVKV
jgi:hypothetical protein